MLTLVKMMSKVKSSKHPPPAVESRNGASFRGAWESGKGNANYKSNFSTAH